jgi:hypothetical protein
VFRETGGDTDPTGTPRNSRHRPQGGTIGSLRNGTHVGLAAISCDGLRSRWGHIVNWNAGQAIRRVFRASISCY